MSKKKTVSAQANSAPKKSGFCIYLGPTITGVIQCGTVYPGDKAKVLKELKSAIEKQPLIASLVIPEERISEDRVKVKTPGNILFVNYNKILSNKF